MNDNGTSNLLLQGLLCRVYADRIHPWATSPTAASGSGPLPRASRAAPAEENAKLRREISRLIRIKLRISPGGVEGMTELLKTVEDPEIFADIAAFNLCDDVPVKQKLLETLDVNRRLMLLLKVIRSEVEAAFFHQKLQGGLPDDSIPPRTGRDWGARVDSPFFSKIWRNKCRHSASIRSGMMRYRGKP